MTKRIHRPILLLTLAFSLFACTRGNGLPDQLLAHLASRGIKVESLRIHAPYSSRGGYVVARYDEAAAKAIVTTFQLRKIGPDDPQWKFAMVQAGGGTVPSELYGLTGRPEQFKLANGGQLEYFYLLVTDEGLMYLVAEYAYS